MRGITKFIAVALVAVGAFLTVNGVMSPARATTTSCTTNSVIYCGVYSVKEMRSKYNSDYTKGTKTIYSHMGVTSDMVNNSRVVKGKIYKNGTVYAGDKKVAVDAYTAGRHYLSGSKKYTQNGVTWYERSTETSFVTKSVWEVYVFLDSQGRFTGAVMLDCGNPVRAKNVVVPPKPVYTCDSLSATKLSRTARSFTAKASVKNGAKIKDYMFDFGDGNTQRTTKATVQHDYTEAGSYTAKVTVRFTVNGKLVSKTSTACKAPVKVAPPTMIEVCELETKKIISIEEKDFDSTKHSKNFEDCKEEVVMIKVCELKTKDIITIDEKDFDSSKHSKDLDDCAEVVELPKTGPVDLMVKLAGVTSLAGASAYYVASRRQ